MKQEQVCKHDWQQCSQFLTLVLILVLPWSADSLALTGGGAPYYSGSIEGTVTDAAGSPISNATVYILQKGRSPATITDANGKFLLANVEAGQHRVFAYKDNDNYPNPIWSFYGDANSHAGYPLVDVRQNEISRGVLIRLGQKASRLLVKVIDSRTKQPMSDAAISLNHQGKPKTLFSPGSTNRDGELAILVPSGIPINLKITAIGYETLIYRDKTSSKAKQVIQLKAGEERNIEVELTRAHTDPNN